MFKACRKCCMNATDWKMDADWEAGKNKKNPQMRGADGSKVSCGQGGSSNPRRNDTQMLMRVQVWPEHGARVEVATDFYKATWRQAMK